MNGQEKSGVIQGIAAYVLWGLFPLYWYFLSHLGAIEIMSNRIVWSFVLLAATATVLGYWQDILVGLKNKKALCILFITACLICVNWGVYIWSVSNGYVIEASMGYYINPIVNLILGAIFLQERLRRYQYIAATFAVAGIFLMTIVYGRIPYIALTLAISFSLYALLRKIVPVGGQTALIIETGIVLFPATLYLLSLQNDNTIIFGSGTEILLLIGGGIVTILPLVFLANALKVLTLSTVGFMQYISPTLQFIGGLWFFQEPFSGWQLASFSLIWIGLIMYTGEAIWQQKHKSTK